MLQRLLAGAYSVHESHHMVMDNPFKAVHGGWQVGSVQE
jgi:hypothetical protein